MKETEDDIAARMKKVNELAGIKESDTGLSVPALWDIQADKQALQTEEPLQVCGCVFVDMQPVCLYFEKYFSGSMIWCM